MISLIIPFFNEENELPELIKEISKVAYNIIKSGSSKILANSQ